MAETESYWQSGKGVQVLRLIMVLAIALLNYIAVNIAIFLNIPFFLDTWATSLGVMAGGLRVGLAGGILYNLYMGFFVWTENPNGWVWAFANIWVALAVSFLWKKGWVDIKMPGRLLASGLVLGLTSAVVIITILFTAWGGIETVEGVLPTYEALLDATGSKTIAAIGEKFITTPADQIVSIFMAAIVFSSIPNKFILTRRKEDKSQTG